MLTFKRQVKRIVFNIHYIAITILYKWHGVFEHTLPLPSYHYETMQFAVITLVKNTLTYVLGRGPSIS